MYFNSFLCFFSFNVPKYSWAVFPVDPSSTHQPCFLNNLLVCFLSFLLFAVVVSKVDVKGEKIAKSIDPQFNVFTSCTRSSNKALFVEKMFLICSKT